MATKLNLPKTFNDYRKFVTDVSREAGAPDDFCKEVADLGDEGSAVGEVLWNAWIQIEKAMADGDAAPWELIADLTKTAILEASYEYNNAIHYAPGRYPTEYDADEIAANVSDQIVALKRQPSGEDDKAPKVESFFPAPKTIKEFRTYVAFEAAQLNVPKNVVQLIACSPALDVRMNEVWRSYMIESRRGRNKQEHALKTFFVEMLHEASEHVARTTLAKNVSSVILKKING